MCLATLRLRELVDALLLLGSGDPRNVPYPSLVPWMNRSGDKKWQQHALSSSHWPWARFEAPGEVVLDTFLAISEQFNPSSASAAAAAAAAGSSHRRRECTMEERLSILGRVCVELRDYECLLALGTFSKDAKTVAAALRRSKLSTKEYRTIFLDQRMEAGGALLKAFVEKCTVMPVVAVVPAAAAQGGEDKKAETGVSVPATTSITSV
jgi:hypothetical protein